jgi:antitoxin component of RelBE/YafQ-DinJ toxin-antitoxin module
MEIKMSKDLRINIRVNPEEKKLIDKKAEELGMSTSDFTRDILLNACTDNESEKINYQDISLQLMSYSYKILDKLAKASFDIKDVNALKKECNEVIEDWGYKTIE